MENLVLCFLTQASWRSCPIPSVFFSLDLTIDTLFEITLVVDVVYEIGDQRFFSDGVDICLCVYLYLHAPMYRIDR